MKELEPLGGVDVPSFKDFWRWVKETFVPSYTSEIEEYLNQSTDHADLEQRISTLQRRGML
jgi:hypothetical protein